MREGCGRGEVPYRDSVTPVFALSQALQPELAVRPSGRMFAIASLFAGRVDIYHLAADSLHPVRSPHRFDLEMRIAVRGGVAHFLRDQTTRTGYISIAATEKHIFALFSGLKAATATGVDRPGRFVDVFRWDGSFERTLELDRDATQIAVDPDGTALLTLALKNSKRYGDIPRWLRMYSIPPAPPIADSDTTSARFR